LLLTKTVIIKWNPANIKWYESKGYIFTKWKDEFEVRVEDLSDGTATSVSIQCDKCGEILNVNWNSYIKIVKEDDKYYCRNCASILYGGENIRKSRLLNGKSFEQWCLENNRQDILERWDYELNKVKPNDISYKNGKRHYFKCPRELHNSELKLISNFIYGKDKINNCIQCNSFEQWCIDNNRQDILNKWDYELNVLKPNEINCYGASTSYYFKACDQNIHKSELKFLSNMMRNEKYNMKCNQCTTFEQWCLDNDRQDVLDRWDHELNNYIKPNNISYGSGKYFYFKCPKRIHKSELKLIASFTKGEGSIECNYCNSFAQWGIDNLGDDFLEKYWDYDKNNNIDPWEIDKCSGKQVYIICQEKDYHGSYPIKCNSFINKQRCSYCSGRKIHLLDSLGTLYPQVLDIWSNKNKKNSYEYAPFSIAKVYWKCPNEKHKDYPRKISSSNVLNFRCPECQYSKGEEVISQYCINNNIFYIPQKTFEGLVGLGGGLLSYDHYLLKYNLLIEFQGKQHEKYIKGWHKSKKDFLKQVEHDRRKKEYAESNGYNFLEIWYWDFDRIEEILKKELEVINIGKFARC
jgi:hypothetical protein